MRGLMTFMMVGLLTTPVCADADAPEDFHSAVKAASAQFTAGQYDVALKQFRALRSKAPTEAQRLRLQWNIARCLEQLARHSEALPIFEDYERSVGDPVRSSRAKAKIKAMLPLVFGSIAVSCVGDRTARIQLESSTVEQPCPTIIERVSPGLVVIVGTGSDQRVVRKVVQVEAGEASEVQLEFLAIQPKKTADQPSTVWPWYVGGVAIVAAGVATVWALSREDGSPTHRGRVCIEDACD